MAKAIITEITIEDNSDLVRNALPEQIKMALTAIGMAAETNAKTHVTKAVYDEPSKSGYKRTGRLRNSLTYQVKEEENAVYVGSNVEYAMYVELGTSRLRPRPFLAPAVTQHSQEYKDLAEQALKA